MSKSLFARRSIVAAAVGSLSMLGSQVYGAESGAETADARAPLYLDENLPSLAPGSPSLNATRPALMSALDAVGIGQGLDTLHINRYGWAEGSYTYNFNTPAKSLNLGRVFDINDNRLQLNQVNLNVERKADPHQWDIGGMAEFNYGTDARFIHSSDFLGNSTGAGAISSDNPINNGPEYRFDIPQSMSISPRRWATAFAFARENSSHLQADRSERQRFLFTQLHLRRGAAVHAHGRDGLLSPDRATERGGRHCPRLGPNSHRQQRRDRRAGPREI